MLSMNCGQSLLFSWAISMEIVIAGNVIMSILDMQRHKKASLLPDM